MIYVYAAEEWEEEEPRELEKRDSGSYNNYKYGRKNSYGYGYGNLRHRGYGAARYGGYRRYGSRYHQGRRIVIHRVYIVY